MISTGNLFKRLGRRASWLIFAKVMISVVVLAYAATISVTTSNYQGEMGSVFTVTNTLVATDKGFYLAISTSSSNGTSCSSPVSFAATSSVANNGITSGHLVYTVRVNGTGSTPVNTKFNVTFVIGSSTFGPLCIQSQASSVNGETIDCKFDIGTNSLPASPYTFKVTIQ
jgi:hypothetical protein